MKTVPQDKYIVREKVAEAPSVFTLKLSRIDNTIPEYFSGQFINVYFPELGISEGKAYSISSFPKEKTLNITVKEMGEFSNRLCSLKSGDAVNSSLPCGYFFSESNDTPLILIGAGIGIAPFRSIIFDVIDKNPKRSVSLFCSNRTQNDIVFFETLDEMSLKRNKLNVTHFITREEVISEEMKAGRIKINSIVESVKNVSNPEFLICGSIAFVRDIWRGLKESGIREEAMYTEAFFSH